MENIDHGPRKVMDSSSIQGKKYFSDKISQGEITTFYYGGFRGTGSRCIFLAKIFWLHSKFQPKKKNSTTSYRCQPTAINRRNATHLEYWSIEGMNIVVQNVMDSWNIWHPFSPCRVGLLRVTEYLRPFWKMKYGYCGKEGTRNDKLDCAHYCFNAPQIWCFQCS